MKAKKSPKQEQRPPVRMILGIAVGIVVVAIVGIKIVQGQQTVAIALPTMQPTPALAPTRLASIPTRSALALAPVAPTATVAPASNDPFPSNPGAQVQWVARNKKPAMLLYHSTNCIPCKAMDQLVKKVRADYEPDVVFVDIITNDQANVVEVRRSGIQFIPTTFFVSSSGQSEKVVGALQEEALRAKLANLKAGG